MYTLEDESEKTKKREREIVTSHAFETEKENVNVQFFFLFPKVFSLIVWQKKILFLPFLCRCVRIFLAVFIFRVCRTMKKFAVGSSFLRNVYQWKILRVLVVNCLNWMAEALPKRLNEREEKCKILISSPRTLYVFAKFLRRYVHRAVDHIFTILSVYVFVEPRWNSIHWR